MDSLSSKAEAQLLNYLKATGLKAGLLVNFSSTKSHKKHRAAQPQPDDAFF
ncbi:MAG: hypothetical protein GX130_01050 [Candidatus Hydrogenedens sp.]|nr:hypothetical protein [Candidatus Hydrogenedens sp.]